MSEISSMNEFFRRSPELFASSDTMADYCAALNIPVASHYAQYCESPSQWAARYYLQAKRLGIAECPQKPLVMPMASTMAEIVASAELIENWGHKQHGTQYAKSVRNLIFIYGDTHAKPTRENPIPQGRGPGEFWFSVYGLATDGVYEAWESIVGPRDTLNNLSFIPWENGILVTGKSNDYPGAPWLAFLNPGETLAGYDVPTIKRAR